MKEFWQRQLLNAGSGDPSGMVELSAGDEHGAQLVLHVKRSTLGTGTLNGYLVFPRKSEVTMFRGGILDLKAICRVSTAEQVIHDPRFDHWT